MTTTKPDPAWHALLRALRRLERDAPLAFAHTVSSVGLYVSHLDPELAAQLQRLGDQRAGPGWPRR